MSFQDTLFLKFWNSVCDHILINSLIYLKYEVDLSYKLKNFFPQISQELKMRNVSRPGPAEAVITSPERSQMTSSPAWTSASPSRTAAGWPSPLKPTSVNSSKTVHFLIKRSARNAWAATESVSQSLPGVNLINFLCTDFMPVDLCFFFWHMA